MSNKPEDFCDYFKIKWACRSGWTIEQGSYLLCGKNPELKEYEISTLATNQVSKMNFWLLNKAKTGHIRAIDTIDSIEYYNTGSIYRAVVEGEKFKIDKHMEKALNHMYSRMHGIDATNFITRAVFREAGRLVFEQHPFAIINDVAVSIENLPNYFNSQENDLGWIAKRNPEQIEPYLKGFSKHKQKPKTLNIPKIQVDLSQLVEKMMFFPDRKNI